MFSINDGGCGCGCGSTVAPAPPSNKRCLASVTPIAELLWLSGLDADRCEAFQRAVDVLGLRDCEGNRVTSDTPVVLCEAFKDELCAAISAFVDGGEAVIGSTQLVGADCKLYVLPEAGLDETPNTVTDTITIDFSATGSLGRNISGSVNVSDDSGNVLEVRSDGLYVPTPEVEVPTTCQQIQDFNVGADLAPGMVVIGSDCLKHTVPEPDPLTVTDTDTVDLNLFGNNLTAQVVIDPDTDNLLIATGDGLLVSCASVLECAEPVTVLDTNSVNLTITGQVLQADVKVSPDSGNALEILSNGLYVDVCSALDDGNLPVPAVVLSTVLVGADCNRYYIPANTPLAVVDTSCINLSVSGTDNHTLTASVIVAPGQLLTCGNQGLSVTCEAVQDCIWTATNNFWSYDDINNATYFRVSTDAGNQLGLGTDGFPFVPPSELTVADTNCINLSLSAGGELTADPIIASTVGNILTCTEDGLFVPDNSITIEAGDTSCLDVGVTEDPVGTFTINVVPIISTDGGNIIECRENGFYAPEISLAGAVCDGSEPHVFGLVLGSDSFGAPEWQNPGRTDQAVSTPSSLPLNDPTNRDSVFWITDDVVLPTPASSCSRYDIHVKNLDSDPHTITSGDLIDGQGFITLDGTSTGAYPFGNDGGESVHLFYSFTDTMWRVL